MGSDLTVVNSARISYNRESDQLDERDIKLINYLASNQHMSPFESSCLTVLIMCPLFVRSQIMRHRTFSYSEISRRYTSEDLSFFLPEKWRGQDDKNKQSSTEDNPIHQHAANIQLMGAYEYALSQYRELIRLGVSREQARMALPQGLMTKFWMTGNLRNWLHFIKLRLDQHAQAETRQVALQVSQIVKEHWPVSYEALMR